MSRFCTSRQVAETVDSYNDVNGEIVSNVNSKQRWGDTHRVFKEPADNPLHNEGENEAHEGLDWILFLRRFTRIKEREVVLFIHEGNNDEEGTQSNDKNHEGLLPLWTHVLQADATHHEEDTEDDQVWMQIEDDAAIHVLHRDVNVAWVCFIVIQWALNRCL